MAKNEKDKQTKNSTHDIKYKTNESPTRTPSKTKSGTRRVA